MPLAAHDRRDWRDAIVYRALEEMDRAGFAWEFLRRGPAYRDRFASPVPGMDRRIIRTGEQERDLAQPFGLSFRRIPAPRRSGGPLVLAWRRRPARARRRCTAAGKRA